MNSNSFKDNLSLFEQKVKSINETLENMKKNMAIINGDNDTWKSKVGLEVYRRYKEQEKSFEDITKKLDNYVVFLKKTLDSYKEEEEKQKKSIEEQTSYLDVNE